MRHVLAILIVSMAFAQAAMASCEGDVVSLDFDKYRAGLLQRIVNNWNGFRTPKKVVNLTIGLTDAALEEVDELQIAIDIGNKKHFGFETREKGQYNGVREFYTLPALLTVKDGMLQSYLGLERPEGYAHIYDDQRWSQIADSRRIRRDEYIQVLGLRYENEARDFFENLSSIVKVASIKVGDHVSLHLSRRLYNDEAYNGYRVQLYGNNYPRGKVVKILEDRIIFAAANRRFFAVPKDLILQARQMPAWEQQASDAALANGGFHSIRFDDRFKSRSNVFLVKDKELGDGWIYMDGVFKNGKATEFKILQIKPEVLDIGCEFVPSTYSTVYGYQSPLYNPRMTYQQPGGGG